MQLLDTRPDLCYTLSKLSQRNEQPRQHDGDALMYVVNYLYGTRDKGKRLRPGDKASARTLVKLRAYADASVGCHLNGRSQYCTGFDLVDEQDHDDANPFSRSQRTGLINVKSWMPKSWMICLFFMNFIILCMNWGFRYNLT